MLDRIKSFFQPHQSSDDYEEAHYYEGGSCIGQKALEEVADTDLFAALDNAKDLETKSQRLPNGWLAPVFIFVDEENALNINWRYGVV